MLLLTSGRMLVPLRRATRWRLHSKIYFSIHLACEKLTDLYLLTDFDFSFRWRSGIIICQDFYLNEAERIKTTSLIYFYSTGRNVQLVIYPRSAQEQHYARPRFFKIWIALSTGKIALQRISIGETNCAICW